MPHAREQWPDDLLGGARHEGSVAHRVGKEFHLQVVRGAEKYRDPYADVEGYPTDAVAAGHRAVLPGGAGTRPFRLSRALRAHTNAP